MRSDVSGVELHRYPEMIRCFAEIPALLQKLIPQSISAEKPLRIFGDHLAECVQVHREVRENDLGNNSIGGN
jgi:hypothetical protein